jgi:hypothetical protein
LVANGLPFNIPDDFLLGNGFLKIFFPRRVLDAFAG